ncbi:GTP-binding protein 8-like isoform X2 [Ornithodoros turicata]|uniref:GTP-binding protein 8-like isoform X2 n=1 Tax=Ornithodoros turicata TaxID=34597 RepID=UPI003139BCDE
MSSMAFRVLRTYSSKCALPREGIQYNNRCNVLQKHLLVPLFGENEAPICPSIKEMEVAEAMFEDKQLNKIAFLTSAVTQNQYPVHELPEVAFMGRSNVGKSSLIKALFSRAPKLEVKTSKKPGHTKTINFFGVGKRFCIVDMPGYGFRQPKDFAEFASKFLTSRTNLKRTFLLLDGNVGFANADQDAIEMFETLKVPYGLVITKIDKARDGQLLKNLAFIQNLRDKYMSPLCFPQPFLVSSLTLEGIAYLQYFIAYISGECK